MKRFMLLMKMLLFGVFCSSLLVSCKPEAKKEEAVVVPEKKPATELLDPSIADPLRKSSDAFSVGDIEGFTADFADNIRYNWSSGDSLSGKQAVKDYYTSRWKLIDSVKFNSHIFLPLQVNESPLKGVMTGKYIMQWSNVSIKYKNGKKISFWFHAVNHYNEAGKLDFLSQYMDRAPIMEATKGMKVK